MRTFLYPDQLYMKVDATTDSSCYRCKRILVDFGRSGDNPKVKTDVDLRPYDHPKTPQEKEANKKWYDENQFMSSEEALRISYIGGYHSNNLDNVHVHLVLCENCVLQVLGAHLKMHVNDMEYHHERRQHRDDAAIQERWDARKVKRIIKKGITTEGSAKEKSKM